MLTALAAVTAAAAAMASVRRDPGSVLAARLGIASRAGTRRSAGPRKSPRALAAGGGLAGAVVLGVFAGPGGAVVGAAVAPCAAVWWSRRHRARTRRRREADVDEACLALAGELGAGMPAGSALASVAEDWPELFTVAAGRAAVGDDPVPALRTAARLPGAEALSAVAAAWEVAGRSGAGPADALQAVSESLRSQNAVRREADAQLASVRATTRLMAALPLLTVVAFSGGDRASVDFLTRHPYGLACLVGAGLFIALGVAWVDRAARAARPVWPS